MENSPIQSQPQQEQPQTQPIQTPEIPPHKTYKSRIILYVIVGAILLIIIGVTSFVLKSQQINVTYPANDYSKTTPQPTLPRSKPLGVVTKLTLASSLDTQGYTASPSTTFATTDKTIYLITTLTKPIIGTKIEYTRYLNGKFLDGRALKIVKPNVTNASFVWSLKKPGAKHLPGNYRVKVYTNGVFEKEISYTVL